MSNLYTQIPADLQGNLLWRKRVLERCVSDLDFRDAMWQACEQDALFFFNGFCWCYEPRPRKVNGRMLPKQIPFIAWEHQVPLILDVSQSLGVKDIGVTKSRGEGASWMGVLFAIHSFLFEDMSTVGLVSKDERAADDSQNSDSLGWKIDWELTKLPLWMSGELNKDYKRSKSEHSWNNLRNKSSINAFAATGNVASGGRKTWFLMDELAKFPRGPDDMAMASTQHVTDCRFVVSTPLGSDGAYFDCMHQDSNMVKLELSWEENPTRNRHLYKMENHLPVAVDPANNPLREDYANMTDSIRQLFERLRRKGYNLEGRVRSPWYDNECDRPGATPQNIAQELDRDFGGSSYRVFGHEFMKKAEESQCKPTHVGDIDFDVRDLEPRLDFMDGGPLELWCPLDQFQKPPYRQYVIGCDISNGLGGTFTSASAAVVFEMVGNELTQVAEWTGRTTPPQEFADLAISLSKLFHGAYLAWESNGPGSAFGRRVFEQGYTNIFHRTSVTRRRRQKRTEPGWWTDTRSKVVLFQDYKTAVMEDRLKMRSKRLVGECANYVYKNGQIEHGLIAGANDDSKGVSHGDCMIGAGVALQASRDLNSDIEIPQLSLHESTPINSMAGRYQEYLSEQESENRDWL